MVGAAKPVRSASSATKRASACSPSALAVTSSTRSQVAISTASPSAAPRSPSSTEDSSASTSAKRSRSATGLVRWLVPMTSRAMPVPAVSAPGMRSSSLAEGGETVPEHAERHLDLLAAVEVTQGRRRARQLVLAQDHRRARANLVGALHTAADIAGIAEIDDEAGLAQLMRKLERRGLALVADRDHCDRAR